MKSVNTAETVHEGLANERASWAYPLVRVSHGTEVDGQKRPNRADSEQHRSPIDGHT
jgi:hypothetical protein